MKIFHLSDLHIGLKLINRDLREDQEYILAEIVRIAAEEKPDAIVIAGDIYDKAVPSAEAVEVFDRFISDLTGAVPETVIMMISGNHDSASRVNCFRSVLSRQNLYMVGVPPRTEEEFIEKVTLQDEAGKVNFYLLPFVKPSVVKNIVGSDENGNNLSYDETLRRLIAREKINTEERNVLVSHQFYLPAGKKAEEIERMDSEIRTVGNIDEISAEVLKPFDYAALGHIHKPMKAGCDRFRYCGTPLACSVSEAGQNKSILMVELGEKQNGNPEDKEEPTEDKKEGSKEDQKCRLKVTEIPLVPLHQIRVIRGTLEEVLKQGCEDYVTVILTNRVDLDVIDMQERIRLAFPRLLEIRRENQRRADYAKAPEAEKLLDPFELCCTFLKDLDEEEKDLLLDVLQTVQEVK